MIRGRGDDQAIVTALQSAFKLTNSDTDIQLKKLRICVEVVELVAAVETLHSNGVTVEAGNLQNLSHEDEEVSQLIRMKNATKDALQREEIDKSVFDESFQAEVNKGQ